MNVQADLSIQVMSLNSTTLSFCCCVLKWCDSFVLFSDEIGAEINGTTNKFGGEIYYIHCNMREEESIMVGFCVVIKSSNILIGLITSATGCSGISERQ